MLKRMVAILSVRSPWFASAFWPLKRLAFGVKRLVPRGRHVSWGESRGRGKIVEFASARTVPDGPPRKAIFEGALLAGGWGYGNLGDNAILAGYLLEARAREEELTVLSVHPKETQAVIRSLRLHASVRRESVGICVRASGSGKLVVAGGGYLNGSWKMEIGGKLTRLSSIRRNRRVVIHATELRSLARDVKILGRAEELLSDARISVRDAESRLEAQRILGSEAHIEVLPDAISLLWPHARGLVTPLEALTGVTLVNFLNVPERSDSDESEIDIDDWPERCRRFVAELDGPILGLAMEKHDAIFMTTELGIDVLLPATVPELVSAIAAADELVSTRMHPALIATILGTPAVALPYCGKVRPTLERLGLREVIHPQGALDASLIASARGAAFGDSWQANHSRSIEWLADALAAT